MKVSRVAISSLLMNLIPVVSVAASFLLLNETLTAMQFGGGILVLVAVMISTGKVKEQKTINKKTVA